LGAARENRHAILPPNLPPLALDRAEASALLGIGTGLFDRLVDEGKLPPAIQIGDRKLWSVKKLTRAFDAIADEHDQDLTKPWNQPPAEQPFNPWDEQ